MPKKTQSKDELLLDMIDTINDSIKHIHKRIDVCIERIDSISDLSINTAENDVRKEMEDMVGRMAKRMGME
jgi:hypothetical protein|tara:strand:- start:293 stop:505 length:213 start_codon:yes stop_codon:yes gene_type:complete